MYGLAGKIRLCVLAITGILSLFAYAQDQAVDSAADIGEKAIALAVKESTNSCIAKDELGMNRYALIVGIDQYMDERIPGLKKCVNDAMSVKKTLTDPMVCGIPESNVIYLYNKEATTRRIKIELSKLISCPQDATIFIYYSGHGGKVGDEGYWVTYDADINSLAGTGLSNREVNYYLSEIKSEKVVCLIDCCYAGTLGSGDKDILTSVDVLLDKFTGKGRAFFMAAGKDQTAKEDEFSDNSIFTRFIIEGLQGKADSKGIGNEDGVVVLTELSTYVDKFVSLVASRQEGLQNPVVKMDVTEASKFLLTVIPDVRRKIIAAQHQKIETISGYKSFLGDAMVNGRLSINDYKQYFEQVLDMSESSSLIEMKLAAIGEAMQDKANCDYDALVKKMQVIDLMYSNEPKKTKDETAQSETDYQSDFGKEKKYINSIGMEFTMILPGSFNMGTSLRDRNSQSNETPQREVNISRPFYMGICEVTQKQWKAVMGNNPSSFKNDLAPVECVSWVDAQTFCKKLTEKEKHCFRLPTEAEWEFACRAGTDGDYSNNNSIRRLHDICWCSNATPGSAGRTKPVMANREPNSWGLYDMHGNVCEWCQDWYAQYSLYDIHDPKGPEIGTERVVRGGSWSHIPSQCRSASRLGLTELMRDKCLGFRVVIEIDNSDL